MLSTAALLVVLAAQQHAADAQLLNLPAGLASLGGVIKVATGATLNAALALTDPLELAANAVVNVGAGANVRNCSAAQRDLDLPSLLLTKKKKFEFFFYVI